MKKEKYLCVRDFGVGYGGKLSEYERALTEVCENFRMQGGTLCDLYGVQRKSVLPELPLCVYPAPNDAYFQGCVLFASEEGLRVFRERDLSLISLGEFPVLRRYALGERKGKPAVGIPCEGGLTVVCAGEGVDFAPEVTRISAPKGVDVAFFNGKWVILDENGYLTMTDPYADSLNVSTELTLPTVGKARRVFCVGGRLILLTARALYVLSGANPEEFTLSAVPVPEPIACDTAVSDGETLYFLTEKSVFTYRGGSLDRKTRLPYPLALQGEGCAVIRDEIYYFACDTARGKREGLYDMQENAVFWGAGRGITSFALAGEEGEISVTYGKTAIGVLCEECAVEGAPLPKVWRSRPTDFGRLNVNKILTSVGVWAKGKGRLRVQSDKGASVLPITDGDNVKRMVLPGARFIMEITSAHPSSLFVKPVITFTEGE